MTLHGHTSSHPSSHRSKRHHLALLLLALATGGTLHAQSYKKLWQEVTYAAENDLPRSAINGINKVAQKASTEGHKGEAVKAALAHAQITQALSADSLPQSIARLEQYLAQSTDVGVQAMMHLAMAECQRENYSLFRVQRDSLVKLHLAEVEARLPQLITLRAKDYMPAIERMAPEKRSKVRDIFKSDLLHVIAEDWLTMLHYTDRDTDSAYKHIMHLYSKAGNRHAVAYWHYRWCTYALSFRAQPLPADTLRQWAEEYQDTEVAPMFWTLWAEKVAWPEAYDTLKRMAVRHKKSPFVTEIHNYIGQATFPELTSEWPKTVSTREGERTYTLSCRNVKRAHLRLYRTNLNSTDVLPEARAKSEVLVGEWPASIPTDSTLSVVTATLRLQWPSTPGIYRAVIEGDDKLTTQTFVHITDVGLLHITTPQHLRLISINNQTGAPLPHTTIKAYDSESKLLWQERTDAQGELLVDHTQDYLRLTLQNGEDHFAIPTNIHDRYAQRPTLSPSKPKLNIKLQSDRSLYRPGQKMQLSGVVYHQDHNDASVAVGERVPISIRNAQMAVLHRDTLTTDTLGIFTTHFALPTTILTGNLTVETPYGNLQRKVEAYKAPTFEVRLDTLSGTPKPGERIAIRGVVCGFDGAPIVGADVSLALHNQRLWWRTREHHNYSNHAQATSDAEGRFTAELTLADSTQGGDLTLYLLTAQASSPTGEVQAGEYRFSVSMKPRHLYAECPHTLRQDQLPTLRYQLTGSTGQPLLGKGTLEAYAKGDTTKAVATMPFEANTPFTPTLLTTLPQGHYRLIARIPAQGVWPEVVHEVDSLNLFTPTAEKAVVPLVVYKASDSTTGQANEIIVGSNLPEATLYYSLVSSNGQVVRHERTPLRGGYVRLPLTYQPEYGDGATLIAAVEARQDGAYISTMTTTAVQRPTPEKQLHYRWERFVNKMRPSDEAQWQLHLTDSQGRPVAANVMLSVADASINRIYDNYTPFSLSFWRHKPLLIGHNSWKEHAWLYTNLPHHGRPTAIVLSYHFPKFTYNLASGYTVEPTLFEQHEGTNLLHVTRYDTAIPQAMSGAVKGVSLRGISSKQGNTPALQVPQLRTDFSPTAYYNGRLRTDKNGRIALRFTLPHTATTWQVRGLATTADMRYVNFDTTLVASPDVAIRSSMPRFVYEADSVSFTATFLNTKGHTLELKNSIEIRRSDNDVVLAKQQWAETLTANAQTQAHLSCHVPQGVSALKVRIWAEGKTYSDGEEYTIPVHQQKATQIIRTPLPLDKAGTYTLRFDTLQAPEGATLTGRQLTLTSNPAWLAVMSLPTMANAHYRDAYTLANTLYATTITKHIVQTQPHVARAINTWQTQGDNLPQNLKHKASTAGLTLHDTPWLSEANDASTQIKHLATFAQTEVARQAFDRALAELAQLQDEFGGFSWCQGMPTSPYITAQVALQLARMQYLTQSEVAMYNYDQAMNYLERTAEQWLSDHKAKRTTHTPEWLTDYLYIYATTRRPLSKKQSDLATRILDTIQQSVPKGLQQKAKLATILHHIGQTEAAMLHLKSLQEHLVQKPGYGIYYDNTQRDANRNSIATQVAALDALRNLGELTLDAQEQMRLWLILQRRVQQWPSDVATAEAVHALLQGHDALVRPTVNTKSAKATQEEAINKRKKEQEQTTESNTPTPTTQIQLVSLEENATPIYYKFNKNKQVLATNSGIRNSEANHLGYAEVRFNTADRALQATSLHLHKTTTHYAYGTLYSTYAVPLSQTTAQASGMSITRRLEYWDGKAWQATETDSASLSALADLKPLRLRQILTVVAEQDYDFVRLEAPRPASAEPTQQMSGYSHQGTPHYRSVGDTGNTYFVERLAKGTHHFTEEWYISRTGLFQWPSAQATCLFAPEFAGQTAGQWLRF